MRFRAIAVPVSAIVGAALLGFAAIDTAAAASADARSGISSPLRAGAKPGCRWIQGEAKSIRICDAKKVCRLQTVPAQRIWACGTVRD
jgi:hypothetical protein